MPNRKRLFFDIETSPNIGFFWQAGYDLKIDPENIIHERAVICIGWKWEGSKRVVCKSWDEKQDDKQLLTTFALELEKATEVVTHNGNKFDIPWLRTRCLIHGIPIAHSLISIDTCALARRLFKFNSNRLDYLARYLGIGRKLPTGFDLWKEIVLNNNEKSLAKMVRYCRHDVVLLEEVWDKMNPYVPARTKVGSGGFTVGEDQRQLNTKLPRVERLQSDLGRECPECGAPNCYSCGSYTTTAGYNRTSLKCKCGKRWTTATSKIKPLPHKHPSVCPYCSSTRTIIRGSARTLKTTGEYKIRKYCKDCRRGFSIAASRILDE